MTEGKPKTTTGHGFKKQPVASDKMEVSASDLQAMQRGYELRLARQAEAITRMVALLEDRTQDVATHMRRANEAARWMADATDESATQAANAVERADMAASIGQGYENDVIGMLKLIPKDWGLYNEDENPIDIMAQYIEHLKAEYVNSTETVKHMVREYKIPVDRLNVWLGGHAKAQLLEGQHPVDIAISAISNLRAEVANVVKVANNPVFHNDDDTPPWGKPGFVAGTVMERSTPLPVTAETAMIGDSETLSWGTDDGQTLPPGESKPGSF